MNQSSLHLKSVGFRTKQEMIFQTLREGIMKLDLMPGQRLIIEEIAERLGTSAIPVREALQMLQAEHLVDIVPHLGAVVAPISPGSVTEVFTLLEALETTAIRIAIDRITEEDDVALAEINAKLETALKAKDLDRWAESNLLLHQRICQIAAMPMLTEITERALTQWGRVRRFFFKDLMTYRFKEAQVQHRVFLKALRERDFKLAEKIVSTHNRDALQFYVKELKKIEEKSGAFIDDPKKSKK